MTAVEESSVRVEGWDDFVAAAVQDIRKELGEAAANRVATSLQRQRAEALDGADQQLRAVRELLEHVQSEVDEARRRHVRLQADLARMEAAVGDAKADAARIRSEARDLSAQRAELEALRRSVQSERLEAQRVIDEAIGSLDAAERRREGNDTADDPEVVLDLRDEAIDLRAVALDEREAELVEWESELVAKARDVERREAATGSVPPLPAEIRAGWGRRSRTTP